MTLFVTAFMTAFHRRSVKVHGFTGVKVRSFYSCHYYYAVVLHFIIFWMPNRSRKSPFSMSASGNSTLRVERRKRGSAQRASSSSYEAEGDRELSSAGVRSRGRRPRILTAWESYRARDVTVRDNFQSRSPSAKCCEPTRVCMTAFGSRCVYYFIRWGHGNWRLEWL